MKLTNMKLTTPLFPTARLALEPVSFRRIAAISLLGVFCLTLGIGRVSAANLIWDPNQNGSGDGGSGTWDPTAGNTVWYNGASDVLLAGTGTGNTPANGATFGGADGTWAISMDAVEVDVNSLLINNSGYTFSGANAIYLASNDILSVAANKTVTFNCPMAGSGTSQIGRA